MALEKVSAPRFGRRPWRRWRTWWSSQRNKCDGVGSDRGSGLLPPGSSRIRAIRRFRVHAPHRSSSVGCRPRNFAQGRRAGDCQDRDMTKTWPADFIQVGNAALRVSRKLRDLANVMFWLAAMPRPVQFPMFSSDAVPPVSAPSRRIHAGSISPNSLLDNLLRSISGYWHDLISSQLLDLYLACFQPAEQGFLEPFSAHIRLRTV